MRTALTRGDVALCPDPLRGRGAAYFSCLAKRSKQEKARLRRRPFGLPCAARSSRQASKLARSRCARHVLRTVDARGPRLALRCSASSKATKVNGSPLTLPSPRPGRGVFSRAAGACSSVVSKASFWPGGKSGAAQTAWLGFELLAAAIAVLACSTRLPGHTNRAVTRPQPCQLSRLGGSVIVQIARMNCVSHRIHHVCRRLARDSEHQA